MQSSLNSFYKECEPKYNNYKEEINELLNNYKFNKKILMEIKIII
jgi:hypothetical protein